MSYIRSTSVHILYSATVAVFSLAVQVTIALANCHECKREEEICNDTGECMGQMHCVPLSGVVGTPSELRGKGMCLKKNPSGAPDL
jgi:hypothetical protein